MALPTKAYWKGHFAVDEPTQSDAAILMKVEDLIHMAMGPADQNIVNFKLVETVLYILARQMRLLEQKVEIRIGEARTIRDDIDEKFRQEEEATKKKRGDRVSVAGKGDKDRRKSRDKDYDASKAEKDRRKSRDKDYDKEGVDRDKGKDGEVRRDGDRDKGDKDRRKSRDKDRKGDKDRGKSGDRDSDRVDKDRGTSGDRDSDRVDKDRGTSGDREGARVDKDRGTSGDRADKDRGKSGDRDGDRVDRDRDKSDDRDGDRTDKDRGRSGDREGDRGDKDGGRDGDRGGKDRGKSGDKNEDTERDGKSADRDGKRDKSHGKDRDKDGDGDSDRDGDKDYEGGKKGKGGRKGDKSRDKDADEGARDRSPDKDRKRDRGHDSDREEDEEGDKKGKRKKGRKRRDKSDDKDVEYDEKGERIESKKERRKKRKEGKEGQDDKEGDDESDYSDGSSYDSDDEYSLTDEEKAKQTKGAHKGKTSGEAQLGTTVSETYRDGEKVLSVTKGSKGAPGYKPMKVGSVEVVSQKDFETLEAAVKSLQERTTVPPLPTMPDNEQLRADIAKGSASLSDTMSAMNLWARVEAAEKAVDAMARLMSQVIAAGVLPPEVADMAESIKAEIAGIHKDMASGARKKPSKKAGQKTKSGTLIAGSSTQIKSPSQMKHTEEAQPEPAAESESAVGTGDLFTFERKKCVTHSEMDSALQTLREEILKKIGDETAYASSTADSAAISIKNIIDKMNTAMQLGERMELLQTLVNDYAEQLSGFGEGLTTQISGFQDQMAQMRVDLTAGLAQLENVNSNAETAAILELTERYEELVGELDQTLLQHQEVALFQRNLTDELRRLVESVEMMREEKADRDEVLDGLRDKADSSRLENLLTEEQFNRAREELDNRMQKCYEKFHRQDAVWMTVVDDFSQLVETKAELMQLISLHDKTQDALRELNSKVHQLACLLGEPKAAILTRKLAKDGTCAVCRTPALMEPCEPIQPPTLPLARPVPEGAPSSEQHEPCLRTFTLPERAPIEKQHLCQRWVGGSHTLIGPSPGLGHVSRERAGRFMADLRPSRRYLATGSDGRLYKFEEEIPCVPCAECNIFPDGAEGDVNIPGEADPLPPSGNGGGDEAGQVHDVYACQAVKVTVVDHQKLQQLEEHKPEEQIPEEQRTVENVVEQQKTADVKDKTPAGTSRLSQDRTITTQKGQQISERAETLIAKVTELPEGASQLFPSEARRVSVIMHTEAYGQENVLQPPPTIGESVVGRPGATQEEQARQQILKAIEDGKRLEEEEEQKYAKTKED